MPSTHPSRWIVLFMFAALAVFGCVGSDTGETGETGSLSLDLVLADDVTIDTVQWRITGNGMDMSDSINVSAPGSTASVEVFGLPRGTVDYTIELEAVSVDGETTCRGSEPFNVEAGETTNVMVILHCKLPQRLGAVRVNGKFNICAELAKAVVSPLQTSVGNDIDLSAIGVDRDNDPITYSWTSTGGTIADPTAASTTYTCVDVGDHIVNISVTDNDEACDMAQWTIPVTCVPGDGFECINDEGCDAGEICVDNVCVPDIECTMNDDCDAGEICVDNVCVPDIECTMNDDCDAGEICVDNVCVPDIECTMNEGCDAGEICVDNVCVPDIECTMNDDCDAGEICVDNVCVPDIECTMNDDCDSGEICVDNVCVSDPDIFCDEGLCATDADLKAECVQAFLICLEENPDANDDECVIASLLICQEPDPDCVTDTQCIGDLVCVDNTCVECRDASQCPGGGECQVAACESNACTLNDAPDGTACEDDTGTCNAGVCEEPDPDCGDLVCNFDAATGSVINLTTPLPVPLDLAATGSVNVLCSGNNLDTTTGKCGCDAEFVTVDPLEIVGFLTACLVPVPAGLCPVGDIDCDGGNDQDLTVTVDHNLNTTLSLPACSDAADPNGQCQSDCGGYCAGLGSIPSSAQCEGYCQIAGTFCNTDDPDEPGAVTCPAGDTCVGGDPVIHPGACQCTCLTLGDGAPDAAGDARFFAGFGLNVLLNSSPSDVGPDGLPCTADDDPSIVIPPQCAPFTTATATTSINNSGNIPGNSLPTTGPTTVEGTPFTCGGGIPSSTVGTDLRTAASFLDSTLGDIAATIQLNCQ